jgi:hypothetical protein
VPQRCFATDRGSAPASSGILYDAFHFIVFARAFIQHAVRECALTKNASAPREARVAFINCVLKEAARPWPNLEKFP